MSKVSEKDVILNLKRHASGLTVEELADYVGATPQLPKSAKVENTQSMTHSIALRPFGDVPITHPPSLQIPFKETFQAPAPPPATFSKPLPPPQLNDSSQSSLNDKNPVSSLNEYAQKNNMTLSFVEDASEGPSHCPTFSYHVVMNGEVFPTVKAATKKDSRKEAAKMALTMLAKRDMMSSKARAAAKSSSSTASAPNITLAPPPPNRPMATSSLLGPERNAVSSLNEYAQQNKLTLDFLVPAHQHQPNKFCYYVKLNGQTYPSAAATNKKDAKRNAAQLALDHIFSNLQANSSISSTRIIPEKPFDESNFADSIASLVEQKFLELLQSMPVTSVDMRLVGRKVIAAIVMEQRDSRKKSVVALGTGNRCINGRFLVADGSRIFDSHAEVIARRCFKKFLFEQLTLKLKNQNHDIFEQSKETSGLFSVRRHIAFHLFISTAPCGDAALFAAESTKAPLSVPSSSHSPNYDSPASGLLRSKIENGEGTIPIDINIAPPSFDGILKGERLRTMSCSDKIMRWNLLGIQGAFLSCFLQPIYLESIVLGSLYEPTHLARGVCCRLESILRNPEEAQLPEKDTQKYSQQAVIMSILKKNDIIAPPKPPVFSSQPNRTPLSLPPPYAIHHPHLYCVSAERQRYDGNDKRRTDKTNELSFNWFLRIHNLPLVEVLNGVTGVHVDDSFRGATPPSRLSKVSLFHDFLTVCRLADKQEFLYQKSIVYHGAKQMASPEYNKLSDRLKFNCRNKKIGIWLSKPVELVKFSLPSGEHLLRS